MPSLDGRSVFAQMFLRTILLSQFEHGGFYAARVRNVSRLGSQLNRAIEMIPHWHAAVRCQSFWSRAQWARRQQLERFQRLKAATWLNSSEGFIGCQLQLFYLTFVEIPDLGLQRRFGNGAHLERQSNGVFRWPAAR